MQWVDIPSICRPRERLLELHLERLCLFLASWVQIYGDLRSSHVQRVIAENLYESRLDSRMPLGWCRVPIPAWGFASDVDLVESGSESESLDDLYFASNEDDADKGGEEDGGQRLEEE